MLSRTACSSNRGCNRKDSSPCSNIVPSSFAGGAGPKAVQRAFDDDVVLVLARRFFEDHLVVVDELITTHRRDHDRHRDRLHRASGRIVAGAVIDTVGNSSPALR